MSRFELFLSKYLIFALPVVVVFYVIIAVLYFVEVL